MSTPTPAIRPKVRAITGFANLNSDTWEGITSTSIDVLRKAQSEFQSAGYDVAEVRLTSQPVAQLIGGGVPEDQALTYLKNLDDLAAKENFILNVGPAMLHEVDDPSIMQVMQQALSTLQHIETSVIIADTDGIHWKTIRYAAELVEYVSEHSPQSLGNMNFAAMAMVNPYSPFFPGSYHTEEGEQFSVGIDCANTVYEILTKDKGNYVSALADLTAALAQQTTAAGAIGSKVAKETSWNFLGVYLAPTQGDLSIAAAVEAYIGEKFGSEGTLTALQLVANAVEAVEQITNTGLTLSVLKDKLLAQRWAESTFNRDSLFAYSAIGCVGIDTVPLPGDTTTGQLKRIFSDVAALGTKWNIPVMARVLPIAGKKAGDTTDFKNGSLFDTKI